MLGRITKYLQDILGLPHDEALKELLDWNKLCQPPKTDREVTKDFEKHWNSSYHLLGCRCKDNPRTQEIIDKFCDSYACKTKLSGDDYMFERTGTHALRLDNHYWSRENMKRLRGLDYLLLGVLTANDGRMTISQISQRLTNSNTGKPCICRPTLSKALIKLVKLHLIECKGGNPKYYEIVTRANYKRGYTLLPYSSSLMLINGICSENDYLIYLYLRKRIQHGESMTFDDISNDLGIAKSHVSEYIDNLTRYGIIRVSKVLNTSNNHYCNRYALVA
jgi:DNA-binding transcriptional regulator GbsR (MarR family)